MPTHSSTPPTLNRTWVAAARIASRGLPIDASNAVTQVPMLAPRASAIPAGNEMKPCPARTMTMAVVAEDDWMSAVNAAATRMPIAGFSILIIRSRKG